MNKAGLFQNNPRLLTSGCLSALAIYKTSEFAATMLPPNICLNTGIFEDWWQSGSKNIKLKFCHKDVETIIYNYLNSQGMYFIMTLDIYIQMMLAAMTLKKDAA